MYRLVFKGPGPSGGQLGLAGRAVATLPAEPRALLLWAGPAGVWCLLSFTLRYLSLAKWLFFWIHMNRSGGHLCQYVYSQILAAFRDQPSLNIIRAI